jgi:transcriptional regulator with XRE-family HTH domain
MAATEKSSFRRQVGARLRAVRLEAGIASQERLAELAGVHRTYVGRLERGESGVTIETLAAVLGAMSLSLAGFFQPFTRPARPRTPRRRE